MAPRPPAPPPTGSPRPSPPHPATLCSRRGASRRCAAVLPAAAVLDGTMLALEQPDGSLAGGLARSLAARLPACLLACPCACLLRDAHVAQAKDCDSLHKQQAALQKNRIQSAAREGRGKAFFTREMPRAPSAATAAPMCRACLQNNRACARGLACPSPLSVPDPCVCKSHVVN